MPLRGMTCTLHEPSNRYCADAGLHQNAKAKPEQRASAMMRITNDPGENRCIPYYAEDRPSDHSALSIRSKVPVQQLSFGRIERDCCSSALVQHATDSPTFPACEADVGTGENAVQTVSGSRSGKPKCQWHRPRMHVWAAK